MGGAFATVLALALFNPDGGEFSAADWRAVKVLATAAPTPGNGDFGKLFSKTFAAESPPPGTSPAYRSWNVNVWNTLDIVPRAWGIPTLSVLPELYEPKWISKLQMFAVAAATLDALARSVTGSKAVAEGSQMLALTYEQIANLPIPGTVNPNLPVTDLESFAEQAVYQHGGPMTRSSMSRQSCLLVQPRIRTGARLMPSCYAPSRCFRTTFDAAIPLRG